MDLEAAFLRTIQERPDEDGPRLVFADWLEERGECARAELIRLQCAGEDARAQVLLNRHGAEWAGPSVRAAYAIAYRRGFVEEIALPAARFLAHGAELFDQHPIRLLRLIGARDLLDQLIRCPLLARLKALHLTGCHLADEGAGMLAACPHLMPLRTLRLGNNAIGDAGAEALADSPFLENLEGLVLHGNLIGDGGALALATTHPFCRLRHLDLSDNMIGEVGAEALARCPGFPAMNRLDLSNQFKGWTTGLTPRGRSYPIQPAQRRALVQRFGDNVCAF